MSALINKRTSKDYHLQNFQLLEVGRRMGFGRGSLLLPSPQKRPEEKTMLSAHRVIGVLSVAFLFWSFADPFAPVGAEENRRPQIVFTNVNIFDGEADKLALNQRVLVEGNLIKAIGDETLKARKDASVIDGGGRTLMPGLIDSHTHLYATGVFQTFAGLQASKWDQIGAMANENARDYLYDGYTTARDTGGMGGGLRELIDAGKVEGPRIYTAGAAIGPTSGHGDWRNPAQRTFEGLPQDLGNKLNLSYLADGSAEIRKASRLNFAHGASFLKLMAGGGVSSELDPLWSIAYSVGEIKSAVEAARFFDTYVTVHAYTDQTVTMALDAGVKSLEHGQMVSEATVKRIADEGIFWALNVAGMNPALLNHPNYAQPSVKPKLLAYLDGSKNLVSYIKKYKPKIVHNVDTVLSTIGFGRAHRDFEKFYFAKLFGNHAFLVAATSTGGELAQLTGKRNPYPRKLGVIEPGAYADILVVDGNPLEDLSVLGANPDWFDAPPRDRGIETIRLIMKDGRIYKNTLN